MITWIVIFHDSATHWFDYGFFLLEKEAKPEEVSAALGKFYRSINLPNAKTLYVAPAKKHIAPNHLLNLARRTL